MHPGMLDVGWWQDPRCVGEGPFLIGGLQAMWRPVWNADVGLWVTRCVKPISTAQWGNRSTTLVGYPGVHKMWVSLPGSGGVRCNLYKLQKDTMEISICTGYCEYVVCPVEGVRCACSAGLSARGPGRVYFLPHRIKFPILLLS